MRNIILSTLWAIIGGFVAFCLSSWLIAAIIITAHSGPLGMSTGADFDMAGFFGMLTGIVVAFWIRRLFYHGKLPGFRSQK